MSRRGVTASLLLASSVAAVLGGDGGSPLMCEHELMGTPQADSAPAPSLEEYAQALKGLDMAVVTADMTALLKDSKACWPADFGNYGPFMVRLAWHCAGAYRKSDGLGGCGGGRQRFEPERSWPDNANLDKARALLYPLKAKYGDALSWGDLFILAGTVALRNSGAPLKRMCFGRVDEVDGSASMVLNNPCPEQGKCGEPWGATTVGLIYVNPEGPMGVPNPVGSVADIRRTFQSMGHTDRNTVALIGGGHTVGKAHGACPSGPGNPPNVAFEKGTPIYQGACGTGRGNDTVTAGFEGAWTTRPLEWDNEYYKDLRGMDWEVHVGPGGHHQWRIKGGSDKNIIRLTSDVALLHDEKYAAIVDEFATDMNAFNDAFDDAWFDLTTTYGVAQWSAEAKCDDGSTPPGVSANTMRGDGGPEVIVFA